MHDFLCTGDAPGFFSSRLHLEAGASASARAELNRCSCKWLNLRPLSGSLLFN
jgi:hypothetical protein